jgi:hypothetical protein
MSEIMDVLNVWPLPGGLLALRFDDGTSGVADMNDRLDREPYLALRDPAVFAEAQVIDGSVEWPSARVSIATEALYALVHRLPQPVTSEDVDDNELTVSLRELRERLGKRQVEVASALEISQGQLSEFERADDRKFSSVRRYMRALNLPLEISTSVEGRRVVLRGV